MLDDPSSVMGMGTLLVGIQTPSASARAAGVAPPPSGGGRVGVHNIVLRLNYCYTGTNIHVSREDCPPGVIKASLILYNVRTQRYENGRRITGVNNG
jgi:hypothetical protein